MFMLLALIGTLAAMPCTAGMPHLKAQLTYAPNVPPPITRHYPAIVEVDLTAIRKRMPLTSIADYNFWTFNDHVPGPFIRVRVGDWLEVHLANGDTSGMPHNVDFHAATGPGGGANILTVAPGQKQTAWLRMREPGLFVYHCSIPPMLDHIANGMYGMILVEPTNGMPHVDKEFYVMQSEFYTTNNPANAGLLGFSHQRALEERPSFVLFNGESGAMLVPDALRAKTGERVRIYFGDAGPNFFSSFHIIGTVMDKVYDQGSLCNAPVRNMQTTLVGPGSATIAEFVPLVPGLYTFVDHDAAHMAMGAAGQIQVSGAPTADLYRSVQDGPPPQAEPVGHETLSMAR